MAPCDEVREEGHDEPRDAPFDTGLRPAELDPRRPPTFETPWGSLALHVVGDRVLAADSWCPHMQGPLFEGSLRGSEITCPWHSWVFSLDSGRCTWAPAGVRGPDRIRRAAVTVGERGTYLIHPPRM